MQDVLVLDVGYRPWQCVSWQEAIVWVLEKIVEIVDEHPDRYINTVNWSIKMPSVVRFLRPIPRKKAIKFSRQNVYARDKGKCQYCGQRVPRSDYTYDHVTPRAQGGKTCWENVVVSCVPCNQLKGGRTPQQAHGHTSEGQHYQMRLLSVPVKPKKLDLSDLNITYRTGMPTAWRTWLRDAVYWNGTLEEG